MRQIPLFRPNLLLRAEAFLVLAAACTVYHYQFPYHWILFACLFLVPDVSLIFSLRGPGPAASSAYNLFHSYVLPALLGGIALYSGKAVLEEVTLIWISHIGFDRALGYGLKYPASFKVTHIQRAASGAHRDEADDLNKLRRELYAGKSES